MKYRITKPRGGVIPEVLKTDHIIGKIGVGLKSYPKLLDRVESGDNYYSAGELQARGGVGETNTCTNQSMMRIAQWFINYYYRNNLLSLKTKNFLVDNGYIVNGECNLSESFFAKISNTDPTRGNSLTANCYAFNHLGCVPEVKHPDDFTNFSTFWREPTQEMLNLGKEFTKHFKLDYAWLITNATIYNDFNKQRYDTFNKHLLEGRLYSAIPVCSPWDGVVEYCGRVQSDHAIDISRRIGDDTRIKDSYIPFDKRLVNKYLINAVMKVVIYPKIDKEKFNIKEVSKEFLEKQPLGVPNDLPHFGEWVRRVYNHKLTDAEIDIYFTIREPYLNSPIPKNTSSILDKIINYIKGVFNS